MPKNPERSSRGGDVDGEVAIDTTMGAAVRVARASFDPGYPLDNTLSDADTDYSKADLIRGYCGYGKAIGERGADKDR